MTTVARYIVDTIQANGIDTVFGIPGVHTIELYRALDGANLRHVTPRNEQGAGFMADGYARATGRVAACFVISGPGLTNAATAMAQAYADSVPMLVISTVNPFGRMGTGNGALHELPDQRGLARQVTSFSHTILDASELPQVLDRAFAVFRTARPRPVHIEIPFDLLCMPMAERALPPLCLRPSLPSAESIGEAAAALADAHAPLIIAGGGAAGAAPDIAKLAERLDAPVVMSVNGRGILPDKDPLAVPCSSGLAPVRALIAESDVVLAIGAELGVGEFDWFHEGLPELPNLIRLEIDAEQMVRVARPAIALLGDARTGVGVLANAIPVKTHQRNGPDRARRTREAVISAAAERERVLWDFLALIRDAAPDATMVGDSAQPVYAGVMNYGSNRPRAWFCSATGFGTLGYALSAAIGATLGTGSASVALLGDGGLQFNMGELAVLRELQCPVIVVIWNNRGYGEIASAMTRRGVATLGTDLWTPDFKAIATAYDLPYHLVTTPTSLVEAFAAFSGLPMLIEVSESDYIENALR